LRMNSCCICGFLSNRGVIIGMNAVGGYVKAFACERCVADPNIYLEVKRVLPHWTLAIKTQIRKNNFAKGYSLSTEGSATEMVRLSKKTKMQITMSENLYRGQRMLPI